MAYLRGGRGDKAGPSDDKGKSPMVDLDPSSTQDSDSDEGDHRVLFSPHRLGSELYAPLDLDIPDTSLLKNLNRHPSAYVRLSMVCIPFLILLFTSFHSTLLYDVYIFICRCVHHWVVAAVTG